MKSSGRNIIAMIPARIGSTRLAMKNLAILDSKPLIYYAIKAALDARVFRKIIINSEHLVFSKIAKRYGVEFYHRPQEWATSAAKSDFVVYDFIKNNPCDIVAWINPTSPLQSPEEISSAVGYFLKNKLDTLITVKNEQVHCVYKNRPVNFKFNEVFAKTQVISPVQPFVYSVMMWRTKLFKDIFEKCGCAFFCGKIGFFPVGKLASVIIKREDDLMIADCLMRAIKRKKHYQLRYDQLAQGLLRKK